MKQLIIVLVLFGVLLTACTSVKSTDNAGQAYQTAKENDCLKSCSITCEHGSCTCLTGTYTECCNCMCTSNAPWCSTTSA
ncbi:MAG: hypothetical protein KKG59_07400 [Nanoarchaeota archaeon]|nr:hypothetical protein [Nanoarchaeota archaeon]